MQRFAMIASVIGVCFVVGCATEQSRGTQKDLLSLPYQQFDQTPASGWRILSNRREYHAAAQLIEAYLKHRPELPADQQVILHFHAAQAFAFAQDNAAAIRHLGHATLDAEPADSPVRWNDYVLATRAFLQHDRAQLLAARERIARGASFEGEIPNLRIVDSLIRHFGEAYAVAYRTE